MPKPDTYVHDTRYRLLADVNGLANRAAMLERENASLKAEAANAKALARRLEERAKTAEAKLRAAGLYAAPSKGGDAPALGASRATEPAGAP